MKLDINLPIGETDEDSMDILANEEDGIQINVIVSYGMTHRINLTRNHQLTIVNHAYPNKKIEIDLFNDERLESPPPQQYKRCWCGKVVPI